jgi:hypothetical protein
MNNRDLVIYFLSCLSYVRLVSIISGFPSTILVDLLVVPICDVFHLM